MEFRLLGPLEAVSGGRPVPLGGPKQRAVLAVLLLHANEVVSTDRLIDDVWGEDPPKTVDSYIQNCMSHLRRLLGRELIETHPPGYLLRLDADAVDAHRFERALEAADDLEPPERAAVLREALGLWHGPPLADFAFEPFAQAEISRLNELRLVALERRLESELELGRHDAVLAELDALAHRHPSRERLRYLQMLALYRAGRQRDALRVYQEARLELVEEYGLEPSDNLRALERMIIAHDPALALHPDELSDPNRFLRRNVVVVLVEVIVPDHVERTSAANVLAEVAMIIERHGGSVRQLAAEETVAVFGATLSHDDDTLRALRVVAHIRTVLPDGLVIRAAVERLVGTGDSLEPVQALLAHAGPGHLILGANALQVVPAAVDVVPHESGEGFRVLRFDPQAEPFVRHFEAPLVGRTLELEQLDEGLRAVAAGGLPRRIVLLGEPGIGKTRLAREFAERAGRSATVLTGRCLAYAEGAPLQQILEQVGPVERALDGEPDADNVAARLRERSFNERSEGFWALRRLFEVLAVERPLILLFEDVHLAGPNFLDLVEYLAGWAVAPLLLLCIARTELLESRPDWRDDVLVLPPISDADAEGLASALPEAAELEPDVVAAAVRAAEGNPLFLEQLVASASERGLQAMPPTLAVLLASRVAQLPESERLVLERAAVAGREFWRSTVEAASPAAERAAVGAALMALVRRRLVRPERASILGEDGFRFHHALIRDAVYSEIAAADRAVLHESVGRSYAGQGEQLDELVGYHLEQAALLRIAGGSPAPELASEAAERLGAAGIRALKRVDARVASELLTRALALVTDDEAKLEYEYALGTALKFAGDPVRGESVLEDVAERGAARGDVCLELRARIEQALPRLARGELSPDDVLELVDRAEPLFTAIGDDFALGRAWHCRAVVKGVFELRYAEAEAAALRVRHHYERCGFAAGAWMYLLAVAAYRGPTLARTAIVRCEQLLVDAGTPVWQSFVLQVLAVVEAMEGRFDLAREQLEEARLGRQEFADSGTLVTSWSALAAEVELLAEDPEQAEAILSRSCAVLRAAGETEWLATNTALLGEALHRQRRFAEALALSDEALEVAPPRHLTSRAIARRVRAKALAQLGHLDEAQALASETIELLARVDVLDERGEAFTAAAEVLTVAGDVATAAERRADALAAFEQKGNLVSAARVRTTSAAPG